MKPALLSAASTSSGVRDVKCLWASPCDPCAPSEESRRSGSRWARRFVLLPFWPFLIGAAEEPAHGFLLHGRFEHYDVEDFERIEVLGFVLEVGDPVTNGRVYDRVRELTIRNEWIITLEQVLINAALIIEDFAGCF